MRTFVCLGLISAWIWRLGTSLDHRAELAELNSKKDMIGLEKLCKKLIRTRDIEEDSQPPSVYEYLGVAQYTLGKLKEATTTFEKAIEIFPNHGDVYMHLGDCYLSQFRVEDAIRVFEEVLLKKKLKDDLSVLYKARNWVANWTDYEQIQDEVHAATILKISKGQTSTVSAADLSNLPVNTLLHLSKLSLHSRPSTTRLCCSDFPTPQSLTIGFVSSDFGIHPVATLVRGLMATLASFETVKVLCFALSDVSSWWRTNITEEIQQMVSLNGMNSLTAAQAIQTYNVDVLIDLNGHTLHSGLQIFSHRPAPVQMTFLGYPLTTGSPFIDYFIADPLSTPPTDASDSFSEKIIYLPQNYIVNDYKQMMRHVLDSSRPTRIQAGLENVPPSAIVFATFSNWQKMDPIVFTTWMNILRRVPNSVLWFMKYSGYAAARKNLHVEAKFHGVDGKQRFIFTPLAPWINHTWVKQAADIVLDTSLKNGHTTLIDALWAGVPVITVQGDRMSNRAGSSAIGSLSSDLQTVMVTFSFKEYEELAVKLAKNSMILHKLRSKLKESRMNSQLFDTAKFSQHFLHATSASWEAMRGSTKNESHQAKHIVIPPARNDPIAIEAKMNFDSTPEHEIPTLLHIGGQVPRDGWSIVNIQEFPNVDYVREMHNLHGFSDASVTAIYSSHTLEHCAYGTHLREVESALAEWHRVLKPGGALFISVPDLKVLASLFISPDLTEQERFHVMRMMYGGQIDKYDYHKVGFDYSILTSYLRQAGFCSIRKVDDFKLFDDSSRLVFKNRRISLNVFAKACKPGPAISVELPS